MFLANSSHTVWGRVPSLYCVQTVHKNFTFLFQKGEVTFSFSRVVCVPVNVLCCSPCLIAQCSAVHSRRPAGAPARPPQQELPRCPRSRRSGSPWEAVPVRPSGQGPRPHAGGPGAHAAHGAPPGGGLCRCGRRVLGWARLPVGRRWEDLVKDRFLQGLIILSLSPGAWSCQGRALGGGSLLQWSRGP